MSDPKPATDTPAEDGFDRYRRNFLAGIAKAGMAGGAVASGAAVAQGAWGGSTLQDALGSFFQDNYQRMDKDEIRAALQRIERKAQRRFGVAIECQDTPPLPNTVFGYALNISKCKGYRDCVHACVKENNIGRDSQLQYIRVLQMDQGSMDLERSEHYYDPKEVPVPGKFYLPVQCMQCDNPPCVKACPVNAQGEWALC